MTPHPKSLQAASGAPHDEDPAGADRIWLSALTDGDAQALPRACALWRGDAEARRSWHAYHLIGDVLRSEELAAVPARDAAFLDALRQRLAQEPVIVAPADVGAAQVGATTAARRQRWLVPVTAAASLAAVAGVVAVAVRLAGSDAAGDWSTLAAASRPGVVLVGGEGARPVAQPVAGGAKIIRDARLDEFLRAHQSARGGIAVAAPGGALHRVEAVGNTVAER